MDEIVRLCDIMLVELKDLRPVARNLKNVDGFGDFFSAQQLAAGYRRKAQGTPESAVERVEQFVDALTNLRDAFASGGADFREADWDWARQLAAQNTDPT